MLKLQYLQKKYAFNQAELKRAKGGLKAKDLDKVNCGFFDDIDRIDQGIQNSKSLIKRIKTQSIKEYVYSNRQIPSVWKNKIDYRTNCLEMMSKDTDFLCYIGRGGISSKTNQEEGNDKEKEKGKKPKEGRNRNLTFSKTVSNFRKLSKDLLQSEHQEPDSSDKKENEKSEKVEKVENNENNEEGDEAQIKRGTVFRRSSLYSKSQKEYTQKEIFYILDDYRTAYPLNFKTNLPAIENNKKDNKGDLYNSNSVNDIFSKTTGENFHKAGLSELFGLKTRKLGKNNDKFIRNVYSNLLPDHSSSNIFKNNNKRRSELFGNNKENMSKTVYNNKRINDKMGPFLNFNYEDFNKKVEITNPVVKKYLESINNFGPYYSHCPHCGNKNLEYYKNLEPNQCINLIKVIKKYRGGNAALPGNQETKNNRNKVSSTGITGTELYSNTNNNSKTANNGFNTTREGYANEGYNSNKDIFNPLSQRSNEQPPVIVLHPIKK